jgi:aspartate racemase
LLALDPEIKKMPDDDTVKHIGILAHSAEGSSLCYLTACHEGSKHMGAHTHPDITMSVIAMGRSMPAWEQNDLRVIRAILAETVRRLKAAGCDFFICPDNTAHLALEVNGPELALPGLHIAEIVAAAAVKRGFRTIGVLGTRWTMESTLYPSAFARHGLEFAVPTAEERVVIHQTIFQELCNGIFRREAREQFQQIISGLSLRGCDAVVLGCTEIPLLINANASPLPTLDSTRLLATAGVTVALGKLPLPDWVGGPVLG